MSIQRKTIILTVFLLCFVLLAGCSAKPNKEQDSTKEYSEPSKEQDSTKEYLEDFKKPDSTKEHLEPSKEQDSTKEHSVEASVTNTSNQQFSNDAGTSIDVLREEISQSKALFGMAYIGYFDSATADETGIDFGQWFHAASSPLAAYYPFISEIDEAHTIGTEGHLYCIIAKDYESSIAVNTIDNSKMLYRAENGDPILLFCNRDGDVQTADTNVIITATDGTICQWEPTLDEMGYPELLIGDDRELLSWDFTPIPDTGFDLEGWISEGWLGPTAVGLAYNNYGTDWWINTWDNSVSYCLSFYLNENDSYDGEVILECFYAGDSSVQAKWQGWWRIETEMEQPSRLYLDLTLINGADMATFENAATVSESYLAMVPQSGNNLLLVADDVGAVLPIFPDGVQAVELTLADG